jgi:hypothetical protein
MEEVRGKCTEMSRYCAKGIDWKVVLNIDRAIAHSQ